MSELSPRARDLVRSARALNRPTAADRERIHNALQARLSGAELPTDRRNSWPSARPRWLLASGAVGTVLVGGALILLAQHRPGQSGASVPSEVAPSVVAPATAPPSPSADPALEAMLNPAMTAAPQPAQAPLSSSRLAQDRLKQEVQLLARATSNLHAGQPAAALKALAQHQRQFPNGLLTEERRAARAQALCALGRRREALAELARLAARSPAAARAQQVCDEHR